MFCLKHGDEVCVEYNLEVSDCPLCIALKEKRLEIDWEKIGWEIYNCKRKNKETK